MDTIEWLTGLGYAQEVSHTTRKPILLDFHNPECIGCKQMDAVTYSTKAVVNFITEHLVPLRVEDAEASFYDEFNSIWTPAQFVLDYNGHEIQKKIGFVDPDDFIAYMMLGIAKVRFSNNEFDTAQVQLQRIFQHYTNSDAMPEAIYFNGVIRFKERNDSKELKSAYQKLLSEYPESGWTRRAEPFRLAA